MKLKSIFAASAVLTLLLAGCGKEEEKASKSTESTQQDSNQSSSEHSESNQSDADNNQTTQQRHEQSEDTSHSKSDDFKSYDSLTNEDKIALALFEPGTSETTVSADELLNQSYTQKGISESNQINIQTLNLRRVAEGQVQGQPSGTDIYETETGKGPFHVKFVLDGSKVAIAAEKGTSLNYQELFDYGKVYNLKSLYEKHKNNPKLTEVSHMIQIEDSSSGSGPVLSPSVTDNTSESTSSDSSSSDEPVTRANVIDKVEEYEGHTLDTSTYTFKEPEKRGDGSWGFSILDKSGDLAGSYIVNSDGSVEKYDADGERE
ncbi:hypothetical protein [Staphylococcus simulans]|uniref:hypothetical protein n=1 Tax=Staphylococcus simulans TaxID=1286 RepID=UPI003F810DE0